MSKRNQSVDMVMDELERHGFRGVLAPRGKHLEISWVTPKGRFMVIASKTSSDWRAALNLRSEVRRMLRSLET